MAARKPKCVIFYSGYSYSGFNPEDHESKPAVMMTYYDIRARVAKQHERFKNVARGRNKP